VGSVADKLLIVDGMNVIGSRPDGWWRDRRGAMRDLISKLESYAAETRDDVTVVLDSDPFDVRQSPEGGLRVVFAPPATRNAADDEIVRLLEADAKRDSVQVVTSDAELKRRVEALGAGVLAAGGFRRRLDAI
jgi:predicted RNA-binding protein with PIN domain